MSGMAVRRSGRMSRPLSTGRGTENSYLPNNGMLATSSSLALAANVLGFEIMELWVCHGDSDDNLKCIFVHASEELMKANPGIIAGHFPQHKKKHTISPRVSILIPHFSSAPSFNYRFELLNIEEYRNRSDHHVTLHHLVFLLFSPPPPPPPFFLSQTFPELNCAMAHLIFTRFPLPLSPSPSPSQYHIF